MDIKKYFLKNFFNLVFMRVVSRVIPVLMSGYIIRYTGLHSFGKLEFAKILNYLFKLIIAYGFIYSIPRYFFNNSQDGDSKENISRLFGSIIIIKCFLTLLSFILLLLVFYFVSSIRNDFVIIFLFFLVAISSGFTPICIYQGIGKIYIITIVNTITKLLFYLSIPLYIRSSDDLHYYPLAYCIFEFLRLIVYFFILFYFYGISISFPNFNDVIKQLKEGFTWFCFSFYMFFCNNFPVLFLRVYLGEIYVGIYKLGTNVMYICQQVLEPFIQSFYPILNSKFRINYREGIRFSFIVLFYYLSLFSLVGLLCYIYSESIIHFFCKRKIFMNDIAMLKTSISILRVNIIIFFLSIISTFIGVQIFSSIGYKYVYSFVVFLGGLLSVSLHFVFVDLFSTLGASYAVLSGEIFIFTIIIILFGYFFINWIKK